MSVIELMPLILMLLGIGFAVANLRLGLELSRWMRRRHEALVVWPGPKPPFFGLSLGIGVMLGILVLVKAYIQFKAHATFGARLEGFAANAFGELMMFVYFGYMLPLSTRITRGLYEDGIWSDTGFIPYSQIGGISWREGDRPTLLMISRFKALARRLEVPSPCLAEVRRLLRDKISSHAIEIETGPGLHLGERDARDSV